MFFPRSFLKISVILKLYTLEGTYPTLWKIASNACLFKKPFSKVLRILNILICCFRRFGSSQKGAESHDLVSNLKIELERCLLSNKEKRIQVNKLQEELRTCKKDLEEFRMRCERAEKSETDLKVNWRVINNSEHHFHWFGKTCSFEYTFIYMSYKLKFTLLLINISFCCPDKQWNQLKIRLVLIK